MVVDAEQNRGRVSFRRAVEEFARRSLWLGAAVIALGVIYLGLGLGQGLIRNARWQFYQTSAARPLIKNLIFFVLIFCFAMLRLWVTLLVLTWGLKQSYLRAG
jgi:predicted permease